MKYIKTCLFFLGVLIGMTLMGFFGLLGICAVKEIFNYLFTHCSDLMLYTMFFIFGVIGAAIGWGVFCNFADKLKDS